jgi:hypothetical protein
MKTLTIRRGNFRGVAYTADGRALVSLNSGTQVRFWDLEAFEERLGLSLPAEVGRYHNFALLGRRLLLGSSLWDLTPALDYLGPPARGRPPGPAFKELPLE